MMFTIVVILVCIGFVAILVQPMYAAGVRDAEVATGKSEHARRFLNAAYRRLDEDIEAGLLDEIDRPTSKRSVQRTALDGDEAEKRTPLTRADRFALIGGAFAAPLFVIAVYLAVGAPEAIDGVATAEPVQTLAASDPLRDATPAEQRTAIEAMVASLAARLEATPEDVEGWRMLARSYAVLGQPARSASAWKEVFARADGSLEDRRNFAASLIAAGEIQAAATQMEETLAAYPDDPMTLFRLGGLRQAAREHEAAAAAWRRLLRVLPADAPIRGTVESMIDEAEKAADAAPSPVPN